MAWATAAEVATLTGVDEGSISDAAVERAQAIIDMYSGRTYDMHDLMVLEDRTRDLYWLKLAVAYQTVWMMAQPDLFQRMSMSNISQDGVSATFLSDAQNLSPLAKSALNRLSWHGSRSLTVQKASDRRKQALLTTGSPIYDSDDEAWEPIG